MILDTETINLWRILQTKTEEEKQMIYKLMDWEQLLKIQRFDIEIKFKMMPSIPAYTIDEHNRMVEIKR